MASIHDLARPVLMPDELDTLSEHGFSNEEIYKIVAPRRTIARRREKNEHLSMVESDRVLRLQRVVKEAEQVLETLKRRIAGFGSRAARWRRLCRSNCLKPKQERAS